MRKLLAALLTLTLALSASADTPPITLGGLFNLTGRQSELDIPAARGATLAVEQANLAGVLGRQIRLVSLDGQSELTGLPDKTRELLATYPRMSALFGFCDTDFVLGAAPLAARQKLPFVTSGATSPRLPKEVPDFLFLACFGDNVQAAACAEFAFESLGGKTVFVVYDESTEYTRLLQQYFITRFQELGGKVLGSQGFSPDSVDQLSLEAAKADLIFLSAGPQEAPLGVRRLRELGLDQPILGGDAFDSNVWSQAGEVDNVYFTTHAFLGESNTRPAAVKFRQEYAARYPGSEPDAFAALGYDTVNLLLAAIGEAASAEPAAIQSALSQLEGFQGVTGTISYANGQRVPSKTVSLLKLSKGRPALVAEVLPRSVPQP